MKRINMALITLMMAFSCIAQTLSPKQEREFFQRAYDIINSYAQTTNKDASKFMELFERSDMLIYNDLMGLSFEPTLSVADYSRLLREAKGVKFTIKNVRKDSSIKYENGYWLLPIFFEKNILFYDQCETKFNSYEFFNNSYQLIMILSWDGKDEKCHIRELKSEGNQMEFPEKYRVLIKQDDLDSELTLNRKNGNHIEFNKDNQLILRPEDVLYYHGAKVDLINREGSCDNWVYADYKVRPWRVRVNGALTLQDFNVVGKSDSVIINNNNEKAFGIELGYVFPSASKWHLGIFAGVGLSVNNMNMELIPSDKYHEKDKLETDVDNDSFTRYYEVGDKKIVQEMSATDITVPVYLDMEYELNYYISVYADLGLKLQTSTGKMTISSGSYKTYGEYSKYDYLVIGENGDVSLSGFGSYDSIGVDDDGITKQMTVDGLIGAGLRINLNKSLAIDAGVQYQIGSSSWKAADDDIPFRYTPEREGTVNLIRTVGNISHRAFKVTASMIFKF